MDFPATYRAGRAASTPARSYLVDLPGMRATGFSPEMMLTASPEGRVITNPLAGTRALHGTTEDLWLWAELQTDPKEVHEHAISVKVAADELASVCTPGGITVDDFKSVKRRGSVQHCGTRVGGDLVGGRDRWDALDAAGALRTLFERNGQARLQPGTGIVAAFDPAREYEKTCEKLRSIAPYPTEPLPSDHEGQEHGTGHRATNQPGPAMGKTASGYVFDNDGAHSADQLSLLAQTLDGITRDRLTRLGLAPGWSCLEVGAGNGTIAAWLADQVGPGGHVLATDLNTTHLRTLKSQGHLRVERHDITTDDLPDKAFDLIHARLVLMHIPQRDAVLERLRRALKPGGTILLDEFDCTYAPVLSLPDGTPPGLFETFNQALIRLLTAAGADPAFGRHSHHALHRAGFTDSDIETHLNPWRGGSPGCALHHSNTLHLKEGLETHGATTNDLQALRPLLRDPRFIVSSYPIYTASARTR
ncbi:Isochorismate synthase/isochorismate lyase [Actinomadura rubteroloni]|uniref:Isochorismate synthase/isochorismate lyase n=1 Tax=Actinomadura rubteroloni TaxID=1926885 RepID=A0A2P4ULZ0_9ACTN|nr:Isochorismate synthase/isochorismate lyase [Actinomadura rubteroloni]